MFYTYIFQNSTLTHLNSPVKLLELSLEGDNFSPLVMALRACGERRMKKHWEVREYTKRRRDRWKFYYY